MKGKKAVKKKVSKAVDKFKQTPKQKGYRIITKKMVLAESCLEVCLTIECYDCYQGLRLSVSEMDIFNVRVDNMVGHLKDHNWRKNKRNEILCPQCIKKRKENRYE